VWSTNAHVPHYIGSSPSRNVCHSQTQRATPTRNPLHRHLREEARPSRVLPVADVVTLGWSMGSWRQPGAHTLSPPRWLSLCLPHRVIALLRLRTPLTPSRSRMRTGSTRFAADTAGTVAHCRGSRGRSPSSCRGFASTILLAIMSSGIVSSWRGASIATRRAITGLPTPFRWAKASGAVRRRMRVTVGGSLRVDLPRNIGVQGPRTQHPHIRSRLAAPRPCLHYTTAQI
jgi:hypothetical protein